MINTKITLIITVLFLIFFTILYTQSTHAQSCDWRTTFCGPNQAPNENLEFMKRLLNSVPHRVCDPDGYLFGVKVVNPINPTETLWKCSNESEGSGRNLKIRGDATVENNMTVQKDMDINGGVTVANDTRVGGNMTVTENVYAKAFFHSSDRNKKKDITPIPDAPTLVSQLRGVRYVMRSNNMPRYGFIAQEVETVLPELVTGEEGDKSVNYTDLIPLLLETIKAQDRRIKDLERRGL